MQDDARPALQKQTQSYISSIFKEGLSRAALAEMAERRRRYSEKVVQYIYIYIKMVPAWG